MNFFFTAESWQAREACGEELQLNALRFDLGSSRGWAVSENGTICQSHDGVAWFAEVGSLSPPRPQYISVD